MEDFMYGVLFAASLVGMLAVVLGWILQHRRKAAFSAGLASTLSMFVILFAMACRNAKPEDYKQWAGITLVVFILWSILVAVILRAQATRTSSSEKLHPGE